MTLKADKLVVLLALPAILLPGSLFAQIMFTVRGVVTDDSGAVVSSSLIRAATNSGAVVAQTQSDMNGTFTLVGLPAGEITIIVPADGGFAKSTIFLTLEANIADVRIVLRPESVHQQVTVTAEPLLSTDASANRDTVSVTANDLRTLPVFDQDYIATLTPFLDASAGSSGGTTIIVDGVEMKSAGVSASAIQEVRINNDPYAAEFTRPGRGRIEITTKPGSSNFHGEFNFTLRDSLFNAKNHFSINRPPESRRIYEGHLTGPVGSGGHTNFIMSGSRREQDTAAAVNALTPAGPFKQNVLTPNRDLDFSVRITHDFSDAHRLSIGYNFENSSSINVGVGGIVLPEAAYDAASREDDVIFNDRFILTPNLINQLQVTFEKDEDDTRSVTEAQSIHVTGAFTGGGAQADVSRTENTVHVNEVMSWSHSIHYLRVGVQLPQFSRRAIDDRTNRLGTYSFSSLAAYAGNSPYVFTAQQGVGRGLYWINEFGSFIQDQIKINKRLQVSLGLRYDWQSFLDDNNNLAPRVSLAYAADGGKTVIRVGSGIFYDRTGGDFPAIVKTHNGSVLHSIQIQNPTFPVGPDTNLAAIHTNIVRFSPAIRTPYAIQYSFGVERQIVKTATITAAYRSQVQVKSFRSRDANAPLLPPDPLLSADYPRPEADFGQIQQIESAGRSLLNALDLSFNGQMGKVFSGRAQYTFSRFENNTAGINAFPQNQYAPNAEWGRADQDRRHRFNLIGTIHPDHWLSLGVNAALNSGTPYTETTGNDDYHTGLANSRPAGVGRNTLKAGGVATLDLLYNHDFHINRTSGNGAKVLAAGISAFNILNRTNYTSYVGTLSSPLFREPTASLAGRQLQFSAGYRF